MTEQTILDVCCGSCMFWFNKQDTRAVFADIRAEEHELCDGRLLAISGINQKIAPAFLFSKF